MNVIVKIPRVLFSQARTDLHRRHAFAYERVGFFSTRSARSGGSLFVYCVAYNSVDDADYIDDPTVGCRIGPRALRTAMTRADQESVGQIHVHSHGGTGLPGPSGTDSAELPQVARGLRNANVSEIHGWMILSTDDAWTYLLVGKDQPVIEAPVSLIGFPSTFNFRIAENGDSPLPDITPKSTPSLWSRVKACFGPARAPAIAPPVAPSPNRYDRQSFLGERSSEIIASVRVGIVGLGGGGSHIVQQLAHLGFKNYENFDDDIITESNLNRLVGGTTEDAAAGRMKVAIASRVIRGLQPDAAISEHACRWESATADVAKCDLVFGCADSFIARRDLEAFCRRNLIPYIDIGMDVVKTEKAFNVFGQIFLSMPGCPCMSCFGLVNPKNLAEEAQKYGDAGGKPQVVWSNGVLASTAVGVAVDLLTDWSKDLRAPVLLSYSGNQGTLTADKRLKAMNDFSCPHYPFKQTGDPHMQKL